MRSRVVDVGKIDDTAATSGSRQWLVWQYERPVGRSLRSTPEVSIAKASFASAIM
jgi:hypothetical protein